MKAVLLAAGRSTRLYPVTVDTPKCLLEIGGKTLLEHQLDAIQSCEVEEIVLVTGYLKHLLEDKISEIAQRYSFKITTIENPRYAETNNIYSLWTVREALRDSAFLVLHADVLFHPKILSTGAGADGDIVLIVDRAVLEETMKVKFDADGRVLTVGKHVQMSEATGTFLGLAKFSEAGGRALLDEAERLIESGETNAYFTLAVENLIKQNYEARAVLTNNLPWIEIDFPAELEQAKTEIFPLIANTGILTSNV